MGAGNEAMVALERLATAYWRPLYVFTRQRGESHESAADAVQGFFVKLLSGDLLRKARPGGRAVSELPAGGVSAVDER